MESPNHNEFLRFWTSAMPLVKSFVRSALFDSQHVEDLLQDIAETAYGRFHEYDRSRPFKAWIMGFARISVKRYLQKQHRDRIVLSPDMVEVIAGAFERIAPELNDRRNALSRCMGRMHQRGRTVLEMRYFDDKSVKSIAEYIGVTPNAVSVLLYKVRLALKKCIEDQLGRVEGAKP